LENGSSGGETKISAMLIAGKPKDIQPQRQTGAASRRLSLSSLAANSGTVNRSR